MYCANHSYNPAVAQCNDCGKGLCKDCMDKYEPSLCDACAQERNQNERSLFTKSIGLMAVGFVIGLITAIAFKLPFGVAIIWTIIMTCIPWGWRTLTMITPQTFMFLPLIGWLIYFVIKFILACFVGVFATPYHLYKAINGFSKVNEMDSYINSAKHQEASTDSHNYSEDDFETLLAKAQQGNAIAQWHVGMAYSIGEQVEINNDEAFKWFKLSADQGHIASQLSLAEMFYLNEKYRNYDLAEHLFLEVADRRSENDIERTWAGSAAYWLGSLYQIPQKRDYQKAIYWLYQSQCLGDRDLNDDIQKVKDKSGLSISKEQAMQWENDFMQRISQE